MKAELKITPPRETLWQQVAVAIHENANALDQVITAAWQSRGAMHAIQRIERRQQFARVRADNDARLLAAYKPLYASLWPEQQRVANQLVAPHHGWYRRA